MDERPFSLTDKIRTLPGFYFATGGIIQGLLTEIDALPDEYDRDEPRYYLAQRLEKEWFLDEAERVARLIEYWWVEKTWVLGDIAARVGQLGIRSRAKKLLADCIELANTEGREGDPVMRAEALAKIAGHYHTLGDREQAISLLDNAQTELEPRNQAGDPDAWKVQLAIANQMFLMGHHEKAQNVARAIDNDVYRQRALDQLARMKSVSGFGDGDNGQ